MRGDYQPRAPANLIRIAVIGVLCAAGTGLAQPMLEPLMLTKYVDPLPNPLANVISPMGTLDGMDLYQVTMTQFTQQLHSQLAPTSVWGYNGTYPGPTFEVKRGVPIKVNWVNNLVDGTGTPLPHLLPVDTTLHGAEPELPAVRTVAHLHGGAVEPQSDGFPEYWFTADPNAPANGMGGPPGNSVLYTYANQQPASTLWYHDHGMGITRLNVYAGLAGFYLLRDPQEDALNLPSGAFEMPIVIQDRSFYANGQLFYPRGPGDLVDPGGANPLSGLPANFPSDASVVPHFFGDTNLVNGKVWPYMNVEPRKYRLRLLNGSNSRFYDLQLDAGAGGSLTFHQIGTEGGLLAAPTDRSQVLLAPAERADVIVDFSSLSAGSEVILRNFGPDGVFEGPNSGYAPADPNTTGQVMKFRVVAATGPDNSSLPNTLVSVPRIPASQAITTRHMSLVDSADEYGRPKMLIDGVEFMDPITELPVQGTTEIWEITNSSTDSHPIHLHLVQFQVLDRFARPAGGGNPVEIPLQPYELGWKDSVAVNRRETVRVIAKFDDFAGQYVWHCHLLEHEDHEMMRRYEVVPGQELVVEQGVTLQLNSPLTTPAGNTLTVNGTLITSQLTAEGLLRGTGNVVANVINRGTISPGGDADGHLTISGSTTLLDTSTLEINLSGTVAGQFDTFGISGAAAISGLLSVTATDPITNDPIVASLGQTFDIVTANGGITGAFGDELLPALAGGLVFELRYRPNNVQLLVVSALPGDYNNNGKVDAADYVVWRKYNGTTTWLPNDPNDGTIGASQFATWKSHFGASLPPASLARSAVPEASTLSLLAVALGAASCRRQILRRRRHHLNRIAPASMLQLFPVPLGKGVSP